MTAGTIKIDQMANAGVLDGTEVVPIVMGGFSKQCTTLQIAGLASALGASLTVGVTPISGGVTTRVIYDNAGIVGEYAISGTGSVAMTTSPTFITPALGTPSAVILTNATGLPLTTGVTGNLPVTNLNSGTGATSSTFWRGDGTWAAAGVGSVTSVAQTFTGGLISVGGSPITSAGTLALTVAGTSGGIPYFSSASTWTSSGVLAASAIVLGGGAGVAPATTTTGTGVVTALGINVGSAGAFVTFNGALGTPSSGTLTSCTGLPLTTGVTGNLPVTNLNSGTSASASTFWRGDGTWASATTAPAGSSTQLQYNNSGVFGGASGLTTDGTDLTLSSASRLLWSTDLILRRSAAATLALGAADAASPVAQSIGVQNVVTGTSNTAGADLTINGSQGTGTGSGGKIVFRISPAGSTGSTPNAYTSNQTAYFSEVSGVPGLFFRNSLTLMYGSSDANHLSMGNSSNYTMSLGVASTDAGVAKVRANGYFGVSSVAGASNDADVFLGRGAAATWQFGKADASTAVAQTQQVQSVVAGTSNTAGANWTHNGSKSTGSGIPGDIIFQTAGKGAASTTQNTLITALTIKGGTTNNTNVGYPSIVLGTAALDTTATDGFLYIATSAGTPTGVPTSFTGRVPIVFDTTGVKIWIYTGGSWKGVVVA